MRRSAFKLSSAISFPHLTTECAREAPRIRKTAQAAAELDVLLSLAEVAAASNYTKPRLHDGFALELKDARHPVIEATSEGPFVANDLFLDEGRFLVILTGPNMGGKSTYLRQTALIVLMAHIGSFVPASEAKIPLVDRIFTRVGASDNLYRGRSTFMVEMQETAHILQPRHPAKPDPPRRDWPRHVDLRRAFPGVVGGRAHRLRTALEDEDHLRHPLPRAHRSGGGARRRRELPRLGARVARRHRFSPKGPRRRFRPELRNPRSAARRVTAGLIRRAQEILVNLEKNEFDVEGRPRLAGDGSGSTGARQLSLFADAEDRVVSEIQRIDPDRMTPMEALQLLNELKKRLT